MEKFITLVILVVSFWTLAGWTREPVESLPLDKGTQCRVRCGNEHMRCTRGCKNGDPNQYKCLNRCLNARQRCTARCR